MRLVVHIGATKAAAGAIQAGLAGVEGALRRDGVYLPSSGRLETSYPLVAHHHLAWELLRDRSYRAECGGWADLARELAGRAEASVDTVILTSEGFGRLASDPAFQSALAERLLAICEDVTMVYFARDQLSLVNAMFLHEVQAFGEPYSFDDYATHSIRSGYHNLEESFRFWYESDTVRFRALPFDADVEADPLGALLAVVGSTPVERPAGPIPASSEPTPGPVGVEALRLLNAHLRVVDRSFDRRTTLAALLRQIAERRAIKAGWYDDTYWGWNSELAEWASGRLEATNDAFAQAVWGTAWPLRLDTAREQEVVSLIDADRKINKDVLSYLTVLTGRYLKQAAARAQAESESPGGGGSASVQSGAVDEWTMSSDEVERAATPAQLRPAARSAA